MRRTADYFGSSVGDVDAAHLCGWIAVSSAGNDDVLAAIDLVGCGFRVG